MSPTPAVSPASAARTGPASLPSPGRIVAGVALVYALLGVLAVLLAVPPGFSAPLYPSAGVALAATLVYGRIALAGVATGALIVNLWLASHQGSAPSVMLALPLGVALGSTLQAWLGAWLVRLWLPGPLRLASLRQVTLFFLLAGPLACLVSASIGNATMVGLGLLGPQERLFNFWSWWSGDTLGVLIAGPITLTLVGRPREDWAPRRVSVGLPLFGAMLLLALATQRVSEWDGQRVRSVFERDAAAAVRALDLRLDGALHALQAIHSLYEGSDHVSPEEMRRASAPWLALNLPIQALGQAERVPRQAVAQLEAQVRQESGLTGYRVFDRGDAPNAERGPEVLAIRQAEPLAKNLAALGVNILSIPAAREAAQRAASGSGPAATSGFRLTQETGDQIGVVVYRALRPAQPTAPAAGWTGVVFVTLRMQQAMDAAGTDSAAYLRWCLTDRTPGGMQRLAGPPGCELAAPPEQVHRHDFDFAGRQWQLIVGAATAAVPDAGNRNAWLFSSIGLVSTAMLAALLLTVTGRAQRIEAVVAERTADLRHQVAERHRTERALREREQQLRSIFDEAPVGIAFADLDGRLREANPRLREMADLTPEAMAQQPLDALFAEDDRASTAAALVPLLRGAVGELRRRTRLRRGDGRLIDVQTHWSVLRDAGGAAHRLVLVVEDVSEQLRREAAERARQAAESANQAKNEFLSRMSHELRTPLNAMLGFAQLLQLDRRPKLAEHQLAWLDHVVHAGWHLLEMINDTLDLSRIEAGTLRLAPAAVPLAPLVQRCLAMVAPAADKRGIRLEHRLDADATTAFGDETRIKQVLTNLLSNAVKYNVDGGRVLVEAHGDGAEMLCLRVSDTGPGLTPEQLGGLFVPYNRLGREQAGGAGGAADGTGIGLVISRRLAELMGGSLQADSTPGQGSRFELRLPRVETPPPAPAAAPPTPAEGDGYRRRHVLYVEDNPTNVEVMRGILAQRPQIHLAVAGTGADGLAQMKRRPPDLLLLDMHLPDTDGLALLRRLQLELPGRTIPVVAVSADATPQRVQLAAGLGVLKYLTKPVDVAALLAVVDEMLEAADTGWGDLPEIDHGSAR